jgi:hypothetical protein
VYNKVSRYKVNGVTAANGIVDDHGFVSVLVRLRLHMSTQLSTILPNLPVCCGSQIYDYEESYLKVRWVYESQKSCATSQTSQPCHD